MAIPTTTKATQTLLKVSVVTAITLLASTTGETALTSTSANAYSGCPIEHTHWGRISPSRWQARRAARAGMKWKIRNRMADTLQLVRGIRLEQCKWRSGGYYQRRGYQCQTSVVVNTCL